MQGGKAGYGAGKHSCTDLHAFLHGNEDDSAVPDRNGGSKVKPTGGGVQVFKYGQLRMGIALIWMMVFASMQAVADMEIMALPNGLLVCSARDFKSGDAWWGLYCGQSDVKACILKPVSLKVDGVVVALDFASQAAIADSISVLSKPKHGGEPPLAPLLMFKGLSGVVPGVVTTLYQPAYGEPHPADTNPDSDLSITSPTGTEYRLRAKFQRGERNRIVYSLELGERRQILGETFLQGRDVLPHGAQLLRWVGDIDRDGKHDFLLNITNQAKDQLDYRFFLSSHAKAGEIVGPAGAFNHWVTTNSSCKY